MDDTHNTTDLPTNSPDGDHADPAIAAQASRLGRGLSSLLSTPAAHAEASQTAATESAGSPTSLTADVVEDAVALFAGHDERLVALTDQLDAACHLLSETRVHEVATIRKQVKLAWTVAASLAFVTLIGCFWAGATTASSRTELTKVRDEASILEADVTSLNSKVRQLATTTTDQQLELDQTRAALSRANNAIDELVKENAANLSAAPADKSVQLSKID